MYCVQGKIRRESAPRKSRELTSPATGETEKPVFWRRNACRSACCGIWSSR